MHRSMFSARHLILGSLLSLVLSNSAFAHFPTVSAEAVCDPLTGLTNINYTSTSWNSTNPAARENSQIDILFGSTVVDTGAFVDPSYSFSGSEPAPTGAGAGDTVIVRATAVAPWGDGYPVEPGATRYVQVEIPEDCATPPEPAIEICTLVTLNPDKISDFSDADAITGDSCDEFDQTIPVGIPGVDGTYRLKVTNSGDEALVNVRINAPDFGLFNVTVPCNGGNMAPGDMCIINFGDTGYPSLKVPNVCTAPGLVNKLASVDGDGAGSGIPVSDDDPASVDCVVEPKITIRKEVSLDGGPFLDANSPDTGPSGQIGADAEYRLVVKNDGTETLVDVVISDPALGLVNVPVPGGPMLPDDDRVILQGDVGFGALYVVDRCDVAGELLNVARVDAVGDWSGIPVESDDPAWVSCEEPLIELLKQVSLDGVSFFDADNAGDADVPVGVVGLTNATYRFIVTNIGTEALTNVQIEDATLGISQLIDDLGIGETRIIESGDAGFGSLYQAMRCEGTPGNKANFATVIANGVATGVPVSDDNPANVRCITGPEIELLKQVSLNGVDFFDADTAATGPTGLLGADATYRMIVRNIGDEDLVNVTIDDSTLFISGAKVQNLPVGAEVVIDVGYSYDMDNSFDALVYPNRCDSVGVMLNIAVVNANGSISGLPVMDDDPANLNCEAPLVCNVAVDKTCMVEPTVGDDLLCTSAIASTTLRYTGPDMDNATVVFEGKDGGYAEYVGVDLVSGVTILTMASQNGYTIDSSKLGSKTTITINGVEEIIHTSCSAIYQAGQPAPLDANTPNPPNSTKGDPSPNWFVVNFKQNDGIIIEEPTDPDGPGLDACVVPFGGANVHFAYKITNTGTTGMDLTSVLDGITGEQLDAPPVALAPGEILNLSGAPMFVDELTMMSVSVEANVTGDQGATCEDEDNVVISVEPAPQLACSEIKPVTALSMVWDGPSGVDVLTEGGQLFSNVQNGNKITFNAAGLGNDVELALSGAVNGSSKFHVSCSDQNMNGPEDCGSNQGNGKDDDPGSTNDWLLDAMIGANGQFSCSLPNTGVVDPEDGGPVGGAVSAELKEIKGKEYKINIINDGSADATVVRMTISWPDAKNGYLHEVKRGKDKIYHSHSSSSPLTITTWEGSADKRKVKAGEKKEFKLKFENDADKSASAYSVEIEFADGTVITVQ